MSNHNKVKDGNFFDDIGLNLDPEEIKKNQREQQAIGEKIDNLIHRTFKQSDSGEELLALWKETLIMKPTADPGMDMVEVGINEGMKRFIRGILLTIKRVEGE